MKRTKGLQLKQYALVYTCYLASWRSLILMMRGANDIIVQNMITFVQHMITVPTRWIHVQDTSEDIKSLARVHVQSKSVSYSSWVVFRGRWLARMRMCQLSRLGTLTLH